MRSYASHAAFKDDLRMNLHKRKVTLEAQKSVGLGQYEEGDECSREDHLRFLALWLSRYIFCDGTMNLVTEDVIPAAVRLASGQRVGLARMITAEIYASLNWIPISFCAVVAGKTKFIEWIVPGPMHL